MKTPRLFLFLSILSFGLSSLQGQSKQNDYVLVLNSYSESAEWSNSVITPVMHLISQMQQTNVFVEHLNMFALDTDSVADELQENTFSKYKAHPPKLLILVGNGTMYFAEYFKKEWQDIPIILCGEKDFISPQNVYLKKEVMPLEAHIPLSDLTKEYNLTFLEMPSYEKETVDLMKQMIPQMNKLIFIAGNEYYNQEYNKTIQEYIREKYPQIQYIRVTPNELSLSKLLDSLHRINPKETGVLFSSWLYKTETFGGNISIVTNSYRIFGSLPTPIFSLRYAGKESGGYVGTYMYNEEEFTTHLLESIQEVFNGKSPRNIPFYYPEESYPVFNYEAMVQKGISPDRSPSDSVFFNKPVSFWDSYKWVILTLITALLIILFIQQARIKILGKLKEAQKKEADTNSKYKELINRMPILYVREKMLKDADGNLIDTEYIEVNPYFERYFYPREEIIGKKSNEVFSEIASELIHFKQLSVKENRSITFPFYFKKTDRSFDLVMALSNCPGMIDVFGVDSTTLQHAQQKLSLTNRKLSMALDVANIVPWKWDVRKQLILCDVNRPIEFSTLEAIDDERFSIPEKEYFNKIFKEDLDRVRDAYRNLIEGKTDKIHEEYRVVARGKNNGHHMEWVEAQATVDSRDNTGRPLTLVGSSLVITRRKRMEQELISAKDRAEESNRLKSAFLANMSHEIRTPLNAIVGFSNILASTNEETEKKEYIDIIENNNTLLLQLISDILDLSKIEAGTLEFVYADIELNSVLRELENIFSLKITSEKVRLIVQPALPFFYIHTEKNRVSQVLINLITNAIKFTKEGSITFGYEHREKDIYFFVKDTGCGIPNTEKEHIFERFFKLNSFVQGSGLGLPICRTIVEHMNGKIGVESEIDKGSTFWFTLPYIKGTIPEQAHEEIKPIKVEKDKLTILIAEDNESNYLLFESILKRDYHLIHAWNGEEAVELFKEEKPHIVLMDINMPKMNGYEATQEIRKLSKQVPIIAVTAYAYTSDEQRVMKSGFDGYMSKPINPRNLRDQLTDIMQKRIILF